MAQDMTQQIGVVRKPSNSYNIFILLLTILSLAVMVLLLLPLSEATLTVLRTYDNVICVIFLIDFFLNLRGAAKKRDYLIHGGGWLDLIGSLPSFGVLRFTALLRLARLSRLARIARMMRGESGKHIVKDVLTHRSQYAAFLTILLTILILTVGSVTVLQFESKSPDASITTGADALWYAIVTITTVGYGDFYPVTAGGRLTAMFIMFAGVGIIGSLASILASLLVGGSDAEEEAETPVAAAAPSAPVPAVPVSSMEDELKAIRAELAVLHQMLDKMGAGERTG